MFRLGLYSLLLSPFGTRECHNIQPCTVESLPPTEACLRISRTSLFIQPLTHISRVTQSDLVEAADIVPDTGGIRPR
jgi:hypothetical protein